MRAACTLALLIAGAGTARAQMPSPEAVVIPPNAPPRMTSDTPEYCAHLDRELAHARSQVAPAPPDAGRLAFEGRRLCAAGRFRAGVLRLRQALRILRYGE